MVVSVAEYARLVTKSAKASHAYEPKNHTVPSLDRITLSASGAFCAAAGFAPEPIADDD